ncbi:beta-N-acetylhexosaminidase [Streptomyces avicenniae]|uniref:beta-N-acetylhexosaminidase n=1 Tax=Streptomyces avicenniae TaxID=500153 RepID=UPI0006996EBF|nr:beta-N-acetylhexosaminidase [Streptomyces avicenniae]
MLVPLPSRLHERSGHFVLAQDTALRVMPGAEAAADLLRSTVSPSTGLPLPARSDGRITLTLDPALSGLGPEGYGVTISRQAVLLRAATPDGLRHGVQTLRQLLPPPALSATPVRGVPWELPCVEITDRPRFPWRGAMLDVARHFMPIAFLHRFVDLLALHKLNVLHLHLTDDQGWRMPVPGWPALTATGAWRPRSRLGRRTGGLWDERPHGGSYTRAELTGLVAHAAARGVTVVPEIEMPGHARAALAAYPHLGNDPGRELPIWTDWGVCDTVLGVHDEALAFCRDVLTEVMDVFPSRHVHIGGDECPATDWETGEQARRRARELGLPDAAALRGWFLRQIADFLIAHGRTPVTWDEAEEGALPPEVMTMPWRTTGHARAAVARGHRVVATPIRHTYLDYAPTDDPDALGHPGAVTLQDVIGWDPAPAAEYGADASAVLGAQAQLWTELMPTPAHVEYLAFPRLAALAEVAWRAPGAVHERGPRSFDARLVRHGARLDALGVHHRTPPA